jgi:hypothetical protein
MTDHLDNLGRALAWLELSDDAAVRGVAAGLTAWLASRDGQRLETAMGLGGRARERWRNAQRTALLHLLAELCAPGRSRWIQAGAIADRCAGIGRRRDLADELLRRLERLGGIPAADRIYRLLVPISENSPVLCADDDLVMVVIATERVRTAERNLGGLAANLRPLHEAVRAELLARRDELELKRRTNG